MTPAHYLWLIFGSCIAGCVALFVRDQIRWYRGHRPNRSTRGRNKLGKPVARCVVRNESYW